MLNSEQEDENQRDENRVSQDAEDLETEDLEAEDLEAKEHDAKIDELWKAWKEKGGEGIEEVLEAREQEWRKQQENLPQREPGEALPGNQSNTLPHLPEGFHDDPS